MTKICLENFLCACCCGCFSNFDSEKSALLYVQANAAFSCALLSESIVRAMKIFKISNYKQEQMHLKENTSEYLLSHKNNLDVRPFSYVNI